MAKKKKKSIIPRIIALIIVCLIAYGGFLFFRCWNQLTSLQGQKDALADELGELQDENDQLKREIDFSKTPDFIERMAREILGWVKPGEIKFVEEEADSN